MTAGILILVAVAAVFLARTDLRTLAEALATQRFGRPVKIGALHITYGNPLEFELDNVHLANAAWGSDPDMLRFTRAEGTLDPMSLLFGPLRLHNFILENANLILERDEQGTGNWKTGDAATPHTSHPDNPTDAARGRRNMPTLLNLVLRNGHISFRTSSGTILHIDLNNVASNALSDDQPLTLTVDGAYNNHPVQLAMTAASFDALHDTNMPFRTDVRAQAGDNIVKLNAQLMDPINFDDFHGQLNVNAKNAGSMVALLGEDFQADIPVQFDGRLERHNDNWRLNKIEGQLEDNRFQSDVLLVEGGRHSPDRVHITIDFDRLNIDALLTKMNVQKSKDKDFLYASANPDPLLDANLGIKTLNYGSLRADNFKTHIQIAPRSRSIDNVVFEWLGGKVAGSVESAASADGNKITAAAKLSDINAQSFFELVGAKNSIAGKTEAHVFLSGYGNNMDEFKQHSNGEAILFVKDGSIQKKALRSAAVDVHALFEQNADMTPLSCFLVAGTVQKGHVQVTPFRMKAKTGTLFGGGTIDLRTNVIDFTMKAEKAGTLALDLPIHASGAINAMHIGLGSSAAIARLKAQAPENIAHLSPPFKMLAIKSGCL